jgi:hypothetical protein
MADTVRITKRVVDGLKPDMSVWDSELSGFGVRCQRRDRVYFLKTRVNGRQRWLTIGKHGAPWTPDTARREARAFLGDIAKGVDPTANKAKGARLTLHQLADKYLLEHVERKRKPGTARHYRDCLTRLVVPRLGKRAVTEIRRSDVAKWHRDLHETPYQANRALAVMSAMFSFAEECEFIPPDSNPCRGVEKYPEEGRERFLTNEEISRLSAAFEKADRHALFELPARTNGAAELTLPDPVKQTVENERKSILDDMAARQSAWFDEEMEKLDNWAEDKRAGLKADLKELDEQIKALKKEIRQTGNLPDKLARQRQARALETKRDEAWRAYDTTAKEIETQKDNLLDQVEERLGQSVSEEELFAIRFDVV